MKTVPFIPAQDPLGHTAPLDYRAEFPFQGLPLEVRSNSPTVIEGAEDYLGTWRRLESHQVTSGAPLLIQIIVHPGEPSEEGNGPFIYRVYGDYFLAAQGSNLLMTQVDRGVALGFVTPELVAQKQLFQASVLEGLTMQVIMARDRSPVHAGAVVRQGQPVMLVGPSGVGKSTLCYACLREGFQFLSEDALCVSLQGQVRLWHSLRHLRLGPGAPCFFPELAGLPPQVQPNGKRKISLPVSTWGEDRLCLCAADPVVCLLQRQEARESRLEAVSGDAVIQALSQNLEPGFDLSRRVFEVAQALAQGEKYRLFLGPDLAETVALLKELTD